MVIWSLKNQWLNRRNDYRQLHVVDSFKTAVLQININWSENWAFVLFDMDPYAFSLNHYAWPQQLIIGIIIFIVYAFEENIFFLKLLILLIRLSFFLRFTGIALFWPVGVSRYIFFLQKGIYKEVILKLDIEQPFCFI